MSRTDEFLSLVYEDTSQKFRIEDCLEGKMEYGEWKKSLISEVRRLLAIDLKVECSFSEKKELRKIDEVSLSLITCTLSSGFSFPCYILEPERKGNGAVLAFHGHGIGVKDIIGTESSDSYEHGFAYELASRGFTVLAPEFLGFGALRLEEDMEKGPKANSCHRLSMNLLSSGKTLLGLRILQAEAVLKSAERLYPEEKIGVMGISGGGTVASFLSVLDGDRLSASVISGYANIFRDSILAMHHCVCNYVPGMLNSFEMPALLSAIAPLPMLWESGSADPIYPASGVCTAAETVRRAYSAYGKGEDFSVDYFKGVHEIHGVKAYDFLLKQLH